MKTTASFAPKVTSKVTLSMLTGTLLTATLLTAGCGGKASSSSSSSSSAATATQLFQVANEAMNNGQVVFANPFQGGLAGNLYIEPRSLMLAPDTATVGCDQRGSGALGLDSYLSQPGWITQSVIYTQLYVPAENFLLGFPATNNNGLISVDSYFATDTWGNFHLDTADTEGDYQFSLIADDAARLLVYTNGAYVMAVDDEKPAGNNNGCLEQTQAAHMSCTNNWGSQTSANIVTVHLKPGDLLPIELQYWQGPGQGIAMMAFYRKVPSSSSQLLYSMCGQENDFSANSSSLTTLQQSWKPIATQNLNVAE